MTELTEENNNNKARHTDRQIKSKKRVVDYGEVFTPEWLVNDMLDLVKHETERIESRFLEPACGNGNFLAEILRRKLNTVDQQYIKNQIDWERYAVIAVSSIYGVDILEDNTQECRERLFKIFDERYTTLFKDKCKDECRRSIKFLLSRNILWGDTLNFTDLATKQPIIFSEWSIINGSMMKRRDYTFKSLVEKTNQFSLLNDESNQTAIDKPVKDFPLVHFLKLGEDDE